MDKSLQASNEENSSRRGEQASMPIVTGQKESNSVGYYIIAEGDTEVFYIKCLKKKFKLKFEIKSYNGQVKKGWTIKNGIICMCGNGFSVDNFNKLKSGMEDFEMRPHVICVFDLDVCRKNATLLKKYKELLSDSWNDNRLYDYYFCTSMPSIEYWFLLHYNSFDENKPYKTCRTAHNTLVDINPAFQKVKSENFWDEKSDEYGEECIQDLCEDSNLNRAISRAKGKANHPHRLDRVDDRMKCDVSYSDMYKLFEIK